MTAGSVLALIMVATAPNPVWFFTGWLMTGIAMGAVPYPPAFAALATAALLSTASILKAELREHLP
ncbi:hypothetical protein [Nocardia abscessus]|uniref:hypothetical protein n=1 Tax=Nocardia abscessus TaxID=120957 RepID=UPI002453BDB8|nr:hypothetical protein [Nocardia abscessus]